MPAAPLSDLLQLTPSRRIQPLLDLSSELLGRLEKGQPIQADLRADLCAALVELIDQGTGDGRARVDMGECLGRLGDPRLRRPSDPAYWAQLQSEEGQGLLVGRHAVTVEEFRAWAESGGPEVDAHWSEEGLDWRDSNKGWSELARDPAVAHLLVPNQPVVGVTWFEAEAYARAHEARLLSGAEHRMVMRGPDKRPYPWGSPFGEGNANTREESLGRPCAIGLYRSDVTPDGVWDLAGNGAEWLADVLGPNRSLHPGSWARPSMASWAKALDTAPPDTRSADLGFRLARDLG